LDRNLINQKNSQKRFFHDSERFFHDSQTKISQFPDKDFFFHDCPEKNELGAILSLMLEIDVACKESKLLIQ